MLICAKDRLGNYAMGQEVAHLVVSADDVGLDMALHAVARKASGGSFRPTGYMEKISRFLEEQDVALTGNSTLAGVQGKRDYKVLALELLVGEGYVDVVKDGQKHMHTSKRPYRWKDDPNRSPSEEDSDAA